MKGLGISNPVFAKNDEEGEYVDQDMEVREGAEAEEQNEQEKQVKPMEEEKKEDKGEEEEKLIDFDEQVDGEKEQSVEEPPPEEPASRSLADRIRIFQGGDLPAVQPHERSGKNVIE